ncbi:ATP-binding protein [Psychrobacillus sp. NPDC093200]|uniref:ATP-binding protein n=1 Tax=Psychrobacillus sp. NPDC093200 TaxID=3390656 RepID=UPI003D0723D2
MSSNSMVYETGIEFDPRVIYESLGSKIIESDSIAIAEQIKNARDAGADSICVDFSLYNEGQIEITDDGSGMSLEEVKENWFFVATANKNQKLNLLGGKGIGRFSLFRIANIIEIITVSNGKKCEFQLSKEELENNETLTDFKIKIIHSNTVEKNGTKIRLKDVNTLDLLEIQQELENLTLPGNKKTFEVIYPNSLEMVNYHAPEECVFEAPFHAKIEFSGNKIISYNYTCTYKGEIIYNNNNSSSLQTKATKLKKVADIGITTVLINNFFFDPTYKNVTKGRENEIKTRFLDAFQGISVYRDNYKIYGHGKVDWLKLAEKRLKKAAENIDNKQTFGYIILDPNKSIILEEKTNREGFIRNDASTYFHDILDLIVTQFGKDRSISVDLIKKPKTRTVNGSSSTGSGPTGSGPTGSGPTGSGPTGSGPTGSGPTGSGPTGSGPTGSGPTGSGPTGSGPTGSGPTGSGPTGSGNNGNEKDDYKNRYSKFKTIGYIDPKIKDNIKSPKVASLINEITTINVEKYPLATAYLLRSLTEVMMDEYLRVHLSKIKNNFKDYVVDSNKNIKKEHINTKTNIPGQKDVPIKVKLMDFKNYLPTVKKFDTRSLKHLNDLAECIDDINLAMHWTDKSVSTNQLQTHWQNSTFFFEFICSSI